MPTTIENTTETTMDSELIATGTEAILEISCARAMPIPTPMIPPMLVSTEASVRNCARMLPFFAPIAYFSPISRVRTVTDTSMMFITPIPPTSREMLAIQISMVLVEELSFCRDFACFSKS